jgi:hypothetical protein
MHITARVFKLADLPIDIVSESTDGIGRDASLSEIDGCLRKGSASRKLESPIAETINTKSGRSPLGDG